MNKEDLYKLDTYNYSLPKDLIAQYPSEKRDESRLLCYKKEQDRISHHYFYDLPDLLSSNDVLVLNNTKVIPARFYAMTEKKKEIEILLVQSISPDNLTWKILASPKKYLAKSGNVILSISEESYYARRSFTSLRMTIIDPETIRFNSHNDLENVLKNIGTMPLPPYIKRKSEEIDIDRYQTVFGNVLGAVAAPTASLHFTNELLEKIKNKKVEILYITLHVGPGTFLPIRTDDIKEHVLIPESFYIEQEVWDKIIYAKHHKKRIIACGTTTIRALEYAALVNKLSGLTNLYVTPDFKFQIADGLITNFHLPKTTLLVLVSAFAGLNHVKKIYNEAIEKKYRFYSYGDAMFMS